MRLYGLAAIGLAIGLLAILIGSLVLSGYTAFVQTKVPLQVYVDPAQVEADDIGGGNYRKLARDAFLDLLPAELSRPQQRSYLAMLSSGAPYLLRDRVMADPSLVGQTMTIRAPLADPIDQFPKGIIPRDVPADQCRVSDEQTGDRQRVVEGKSVSVGLDLGF